MTDIVLNPDAHARYGAPVGCGLVRPSHSYPGPGGVVVDGGTFTANQSASTGGALNLAGVRQPDPP